MLKGGRRDGVCKCIKGREVIGKEGGGRFGPYQSKKGREVLEVSLGAHQSKEGREIFEGKEGRGVECAPK